MASSLETNKVLAALLTAGIFASGAGVASRIIYHPTVPDEPAYFIEVTDTAVEGGGGSEEPEVTLAALLPSADVAAGEKGAKKCAACHTFDEGGANKIGPNLWSILGREIGSVAGFGYSDVLAGMEEAWDYDSLDAFLAKPKDFAPGTKMAYAGMKKADDRADLILYLRSLAADPLPLPEAEEQQSAENVENTTEEATETVEKTAEAAAETVEETAGVVADEAQEAAENVAETAEAATEAASEAVEGTVDVVEKAADAVADETVEAVDAATTAVVETAEETIAAAASKVEDTATAVTAAAGSTVAAVVDKAADATKAVAGDASGLVTTIALADVAAGEKVSKKCKACHVFDEGGKNKLGPALWGVVGRDIASYDGYNYSGALQGMDGEWTYDRLDQFLAAPKKYIPGTKMVFAGVKKEADRANLILYLRSLDNDPAPLTDGG